MKDIFILIPNQKCLLKIRALAPVEIHLSLTNIKILKAEKEERESIKKKEQEWYLWEELSYISKESVNTCGIILQVFLF